MIEKSVAIELKDTEDRGSCKIVLERKIKHSFLLGRSRVQLINSLKWQQLFLTAVIEPLTSHRLLFSAHIFNMEGKSSTSRDALFTFTFQLSGQNHLRAILNLKFFITNYSKFVVACDSNSKISDIGSEFWFFAEKLGFLEKKT